MNPHITKPNRYINLDYLRSITDNDQEFMRKMIDSFITQTPEMTKNMQKHYRQQQWKELGKVAHKIRPLLTFMGMSQSKELSEKIETICLDSTVPQELEHQVSQLQEDCKAAYQELEKYLQNEQL